MNKKNLVLGAAVVVIGAGLVAVTRTSPPAASKDAGVTAAAAPDVVTVSNQTGADTTVYVAFGADSKVGPADWPGCPSSGLVCQFSLGAHVNKDLPTSGKYLNATMSFGIPVGCGSTKAEMNLNNPKWYDVTDVSLVDGFNVPMRMEVRDSSGSHTLEAKTATGNEKAFGVYPNGCDICTARQSPPCGIQPGKDGCKAGEQYKPDVPCQYQGSTIGGGSTVTVQLLQ